MAKVSNQSTGKRLKLLRTEKGVKARWLAEKIGISEAYISMLESGDRTWTPKLVQKYEEALA